MQGWKKNNGSLLRIPVLKAPELPVTPEHYSADLWKVFVTKPINQSYWTNSHRKMVWTGSTYNTGV